MIDSIKKMIHYFSDDAKRQRHHKAMVDFLSQAQDRIHLEHLENQWFREHGYR